MKKYMEEALKEAKKAAAMGEIPIGAVIVKDGEIIGRGHNETETGCDPTSARRDRGDPSGCETTWRLEASRLQHVRHY